MQWLIIHMFIYVAVNAFVIAVWVMLGGGSVEQLQKITNEPSNALNAGFWPIWPILAWGVALVTHAGVAISNAVFAPTARRRRRRMAKHAAVGASQLTKEVLSALEGAHGRRKPHPEPRGDDPSAAISPSRRWVTVMFCDIADSTSHNERLGDDEWHSVLAHIRATVRSALAQRGGDEVGTQGDGMLSRFDTPADAVLCGIDIQSELGVAREASDFVPEVRIGVHAGEAVEEDGDLVGRVINLASRVTDAASPGEILVTEPVADQLVGKLELEDKGLRELKGLTQPRHLLSVRWTDGAQT